MLQSHSVARYNNMSRLCTRLVDFKYRLCSIYIHLGEIFGGATQPPIFCDDFRAEHAPGNMMQHIFTDFSIGIAIGWNCYRLEFLGQIPEPYQYYEPYYYVFLYEF
jgi:hypothetical protein